MTGNNKFWRASLAGLASVAMLATMGVAASTANALQPAQTAYGDATGAWADVKVYTPDQPYVAAVNTSAQWGKVLDQSVLDPYAASGDHKVFDYFSYDQAGKDKIGDVVVVKGDTKVFAQYKEAVTVSFDVNNDGKIVAADGDKTIDVAKGSSLTRADYAEAFPTSEPSKSGEVFAGWTLTRTLSGSNDDLYTTQALDADTTLYARFDTPQNLSTVSFRDFGTTKSTQRYTLADNAFPEFRTPKVANWQTEDQKAYDFTKAVPNSNEDGSAADLILVAPSAAELRTVSVKYDWNGAVEATAKDYETTADQKPVKPVDPVQGKAVFLGWFTYDGKKIDFDKAISDQANFNATTNEITLHAEWDTTHVAELIYNLGYEDPTITKPAQQVEYVYAGSEHELPAGLEEYYQTEAQQDANKGEYTQRKLTGWYQGDASKDVVTKATAPAKGTATAFNAVWTGSFSVKLNGNGGKFDGNTYKWVTASDGQSLQDVVVTPVRSGYTFDKWTKAGDDTLVANLYKNYFYKEAHPDVAVETINGNDELVAQWKATSVEVTEATFNFNGVLKYDSKDKDYVRVEAAGYTADSAKAFVDAQYALHDEYLAYTKLSGQAKIDAAAKLAPKYADAKALLVKSDVPVQPEVEKVAVYRLYNPGLPQVAQHLYTSNVAEYNNLVTNHGWKGEGIVFYTTSDKTAKTVWRVYNPFTSEHFLTSDQAEYEDLYQNKGWSDDGPAWYIPADGDADVYRLRNAATGEHLYTVNAAEKDNLVDNAGWTLEGVQYKVYAK
ncbi:InlB B-repeat-containing protein [Bifidobacterium vespertilionis]|uniref:InlB B-repeat-containing protein n=1 Tax=Bifidobacterium vespertilionis TaxID=2562524 RepID=UPI001BDC5B3D|nr:InlB B-repeat-containing protein [Bifidobacterium vespertilionis]MBT1179637.1 InlB B-repeat-containing protein [Bifidobacterium vespertilionis]